MSSYVGSRIYLLALTTLAVITFYNKTDVLFSELPVQRVQDVPPSFVFGFDEFPGLYLPKNTYKPY